MRIKRVCPLLLALGLQVMPVVRVALPTTQAVSPAAWTIVLRLAAGAVALLGSHHAVSAATAIVAPYTVNATNGIRYIRTLGTSVRTAYSWSANTAPLNTAVYPLTPGLYLTNLTGKIGGTPVQAGTSNITITAWENNNNSGGQVSSVFAFTIAAGAGPPVIVAPMTNQAVARGGTATFTVGAAGLDPLSYLWQFGGAVIPNATSATYALPNVQAVNDGVYTVIVSNALGSATNSSTLTVNLPPTITTPPAAQSVAPGANVTLAVASTGTAPFSYRWQYAGVSIFGGTNSTLSLTNVQSIHSGTYTVIVSNPYGSANASATLTVNGAAAIISPPQSRAAALGSTTSFSVVAGGEPPLTYQWQKDGAALPGKTAATLSLTGIKLSDAGRYSVLVSNSLGTAGSTNDVFLRISPSSVSSLVQLFPLSKVWRYNATGQNLGAAWREFDYNDASWSSGAGVLAKEDSGNATVYPLIGTALTTNFGAYFVTNFYFRTHFTITNKTPVTSLAFSNVIDDGAVFYLNGTEIFRYNMPTGAVAFSTLASGNLTEGVFTVSNIAPALLVQGDNVIGVEVHQVNNTSSDIVMGLALFNTIAVPNVVPLFLTQPIGQNVLAGTAISLSASADGTAAVTYQWYKNDVAVPGAISTTLSFPSSQVTDSGSFALVASNPYGKATSQVAVVTITAPNVPPLLDVIPDQVVYTGDVLLLTAHATDNDTPAQSLSFTLDPGAPSGAAIDPVTGQLTWPSAGAPLLIANSFTVRVTDNGSPSLSATRTFQAVVTANHAPALAPIPTLAGDVLTLLRYTNSASDADLAQDQLTFSLAPGAPAGARVHPTKGIFYWRPSRAQAASTNAITVSVADNGAPSRSDSKSFQVVVGDYAEITLGQAVLLAGDSATLPITLGTSARLTNVTFSVEFSGSFTAWSIQPASGSGVQADLLTIETNRLRISLSAGGGTLPASAQPIAQLGFTVAADQPSAFILLTNGIVTALRSDGTGVNRTLYNYGRVISILNDPLLEAVADTNSVRSIILYGRPGNSHTVETSSEPRPDGTWNHRSDHPLSTLFQVIPLNGEFSGTLFYRVR